MLSLAGKLLVAMPTLEDPNFHRTVVFILDHDEQGAAGVVINRPTDVPVVDHLEDWSSLVSDPAVIFVGGPVQREVAIAVALREPDEDWTPVIGGIGVVDLGQPPELQGDPKQVRIFSGYSGWDAAQLEWELAIDSWFVLDALPDDLLTNEPEQLWQTVLGRQPGHLAWYANYPLDPSLN